MIVRGLSFLWRKDRFSYLALVVAIMSVLVFTDQTYASTNFSPVVVDYSRLSGNYDLPMPISCSVVQSRVVDTRTPGGYNAPLSKRLCVYRGVDFSVGVGSVYSGSAYVSFGDDGLFYKVDTLTSDGAYLLRGYPGTNLITLASGRSGATSSSPLLYNNIFDVIMPSSGYGAPYRLDEEAIYSKSLVHVPDASQYGWSVSSSGNYLVHVEQYYLAETNYQQEIYLTDINSGKVRKIGNLPASDDFAPPVTSVSEDGSIVVAAYADSIRIYRTGGECAKDDSVHGECTFTDHPMKFNEIGYVLGLSDQRPSHDFSTITYVLQLYGDQRVMATVDLRGNSEFTRLDYLALGDSYSSGEGDVSDNGVYYLPGTKEPGMCHLSSRSYPFSLQNWWRIERSAMASIACSGAQILLDYVERSASYLGQGGRLNNLSTRELQQERTSALAFKKPGIVAQIEFVKKYKPKVVTLTGGGNDVGFADVLGYCASGASVAMMPDTCNYAQEGSLPYLVLRRSIDNQYRTMAQLISEIRAASPETKVYIVGYPQFVASNLFCSLNIALLDQQERQMMRQMTSRLNDVLSKVAADYGAVFIDIEDVLEGGQLCQGGEYVSGLFDNGLVNAYRGITQEMFHPNAAGHLKMAHAIFSKVPSIGAHMGTLVRPGANSSDTYLSSPASRQADLMKSIIDPYTLQTIQASKATFRPNSSVSATMFSEPTQLGNFVVDDDGGLSADVVLPGAVAPGRHMIVLEGVTYSGEPLTLYQFVTVTSGRLGDMDGDGVPDGQDRCNFISKWVDEFTGIDICGRTVPLASHGDQTVSSYVSDEAVMGSSFDYASNQNTQSASIPNGLTIAELDEMNTYEGGPVDESESANEESHMLWVWAIIAVVSIIALSISMKGRHGQSTSRRKP